MRFPLITLAVGFFTVAQSIPTPPANETSSSLLNPRADPSGKVHWTIHETCYTGDDADNKKKAVLDSVKIITDRSGLAVESLGKWKTECRGIMGHIGKNKDIRSNCELLLTIDKWEEMIDTGIKFLRASSEIQGPVGGGDSKFEKSDDWNNLRRGGEHYNNFIIYCAPDLETRKNDGRQDQDWDNGQDRFYLGTTLKEFRDAWTQDQNKAPDEIVLTDTHKGAITLINDVAFIDATTGKPIEERKEYAGTITLNPSKLRKDSIRGYNVHRVADEQTLAKALNAKDLPNGVGQIEVLVGLPGLIHHEMFHTWGLGQLKDDDDSKKSYGWDAMVTNKDQKLPEYFMYLGLLMDLTLWGVRVTPGGNLERMKH